MTEQQKQLVLDRDWNAMIASGGNVYFLSKLFFCDEKSFEWAASQMTGMPQDKYRQMMINGGRSIKGNRFEGKDD